MDRLSVSEKTELADQIAGRLWSDISPDIEQAHLDTVERRVREVESGQVECISGTVAAERIRQSISQAAQ